MTFSPDAETYIVESVLDAARDEQDVIVQFTNGLANAQSYVTNATVSITAADGKVFVAEPRTDSIASTTVESKKVMRTFYRVSMRNFQHVLAPGTQYALKVDVPGRETITGVTTIPVATNAPFDSMQIGELRRDTETLNISWPVSQGVRMHQVVIGTKGEPVISVFAESSYSLAGNTMTSRGSRASYLFEQGKIYDVKVVAVDDHYYEYFRSRNVPSGQPVRQGQLDGAVGVFGSVAPVKTLRFLVK